MAASLFLRTSVFKCKLVGMRRIVYSVASSLDGFIAGPNGEYDWIMPDSSFDFAALWGRFDTLLMGRRTFEVALTRFELIKEMGKKIVVVSTTLDSAQNPSITVVRSGIGEAVRALKADANARKDIWLMGGGVLFRSLLDIGLVDIVELAVMPVMLGGGVPLLPAGSCYGLHIEAWEATANGILRLQYSVIQ